MKLATRLLDAALIGLLWTTAAIAQEEHQHQHDGNAPEIGRVGFPISCSPISQQRFNRAIAWLHSFEYDRAEREFAGLIETDPGCAMAYWGIAMSYYHPLWAPPDSEDLKKGAAAAGKARTIVTSRSRIGTCAKQRVALKLMKTSRA